MRATTAAVRIDRVVYFGGGVADGDTAAEDWYGCEQSGWRSVLTLFQEGRVRA